MYLMMFYSPDFSDVGVLKGHLLKKDIIFSNHINKVGIKILLVPFNQMGIPCLIRWIELGKTTLLNYLTCFY